jgi:hypothetical protein
MAAWVVPVVMAAMGAMKGHSQRKQGQRQMMLDANRVRWSPFISLPEARTQRKDQATQGALQGALWGAQFAQANPELFSFGESGGGGGSIDPETYAAMDLYGGPTQEAAAARYTQDLVGPTQAAAAARQQDFGYNPWMGG